MTGGAGAQKLKRPDIDFGLYSSSENENFSDLFYYLGSGQAHLYHADEASFSSAWEINVIGKKKVCLSRA
jgi:hypothetical protein